MGNITGYFLTDYHGGLHRLNDRLNAFLESYRKGGPLLPLAEVRSTADLTPVQRTYDWGTLEFVFTQFDILYRALAKDGREIKKGSEEFPISGEKSSEETIKIVAQRVADLAHRVNELS